MNLEERFAALGIKVPEIWRPNNTVDLQKYAGLACDQYAAQPEYWDRVSNFVGDAPSALNMILPEAFLLRGDRDYAKRADAMECYLSDGTLENKGETMVFCRRKTPDGERRGLIVAFDMEQYDFNPDSKLLIRATEETVLSRVPPRVEIRKQSPLELPHVLVLIDDRENLLMRALDVEAGNCPFSTISTCWRAAATSPDTASIPRSCSAKWPARWRFSATKAATAFSLPWATETTPFAAAKSYWRS